MTAVAAATRAMTVGDRATWRDWLPGAISGGIVVVLILSGILGLILSRPGVVPRVPALDGYIATVLWFSLVQAALSAAISVGLAIPAARALARRGAFPGRALLVRTLALPMVVPAIVGVLAVIAVYGRGGWINEGLSLLGLAVRLDVYGLTGILIAHVFFNMPFATRVLLLAWSAIPGETWRLAAQLGLSGPQVFRLIEWPILRRIVPGLAGLVFLLCFTSFAIVLALGGGPPNATLEVAIYQALRFDFDVERAIALAVLQIGVCGAVVGALALLARPVPTAQTVGLTPLRPDTGNGWGRLGDGAAILVTVLILGLPLVALVVNAAAGPVWTALDRPALWAAAGRSLAVAGTAALLAVALGCALLATTRSLRLRRGRRATADAIETAGVLVLVVPPFVIAAGWFVMLRPVVDVFALGLGFVAVIDALMALPFVLRIIGPAANDAMARNGRLADSLGLSPWQRLWLIDGPLLRRPIGLALALAGALSFGNLGVVTLFGSEESETLPLYLYRLMGAYRMDEAAVVGLGLVGACLGLFLVVERAVGGRSRD